MLRAIEIIDHNFQLRSITINISNAIFGQSLNRKPSVKARPIRA